MKPPIMIKVHTVLSMAFLFFAATNGCCVFFGVMVLSPACPSPGETPSSNLTLLLFGLEGVLTPGPDGVKSLGVLRFRLEGNALDGG